MCDHQTVRKRDVLFPRLILNGTAVGVAEHLISLAPRTILDYKQYFHDPQARLISNVYFGGVTRYYKGIIPSLSGVALAHIALFGCLLQSESTDNKFAVAAYGGAGKALHDVFIIPGDNIRMRANIKNISSAQAYRSIIASKGVVGLFSGLSARLLMNIPAGAVEFLVMGMCKEDTSIAKPYLYGALAGICSSIVVSPIDTVKTFVQLSHKKEVSVKEICKHVLDKRGFVGFFRGMWLRVVSASLSYGTFKLLSRE